MISITSRKLIHDRSEVAIRYRNQKSKTPLKQRNDVEDIRRSTSVISSFRPKLTKILPNVTSDKITESIGPLYKCAQEIYAAKCMDLGISVVPEQEKRFQILFHQGAEKRKLSLSDQKLSAESSEVLSRVLQDSRYFSYINLSKNKLGDIGIKKILTSLQLNKEIVHLDISSNDISQLTITPILYLLAKHSSLYSADLSSHQFMYRNKIGPSEGLLTLLRSRTLAYLNLCGTNIGTEGMKYIVLGLENNHTLVSLNLSSNSIKGTVIKDFVRVLVTSKVSDLNLENNLLEDMAAEEFSYFFTGYYGYGAITRVSLGRNMITTEGGYKLFESLVRESYLEYLNLENNNFGGYLDVMQRFMNGNQRLKFVNLANCGLKLEAFCKLCEGLGDNIGVETLILSGNSCKDAGAIYMAKALKKNNCLKKLDISTNNIRNAGGIEIANALRFNKSLKSLWMNDNELKDDAGDCFSSILGGNYSLVSLKLHLNPMSAKYPLDIQRYLSRNKSLENKIEVTRIVEGKSKLIIAQNAAETVKRQIVEQKVERDYIKNKIGGYQKKYEMVKNSDDAKLEELKKEFSVIREKNSELSKVLHEVNMELRVSNI